MLQYEVISSRCADWLSIVQGKFQIWLLNTLRPRQIGRSFPDDIFKCIFLNENVWNSIKISLEFVPRDPINNIPALVQIMAWRRPGDKPLSSQWWLLYRRIYASLGLNELRSEMHFERNDGLVVKENNSIWPSDAICYHGSWSTLVQIMACCLMAPSHNLNQCQCIIT